MGRIAVKRALQNISLHWRVSSHARQGALGRPSTRQSERGEARALRGAFLAFLSLSPSSWQGTAEVAGRESAIGCVLFVRALHATPRLGVKAALLRIAPSV